MYPVPIAKTHFQFIIPINENGISNSNVWLSSKLLEHKSSDIMGVIEPNTKKHIDIKSASIWKIKDNPKKSTKLIEIYVYHFILSHPANYFILKLDLLCN